jgi:hypothetical protein
MVLKVSIDSSENLIKDLAFHGGSKNAELGPGAEGVVSGNARWKDGGGSGAVD